MKSIEKKKQKFCFEITHKVRRTLYLYAANDVERQEWIDAIARLIKLCSDEEAAAAAADTRALSTSGQMVRMLPPRTNSQALQTTEKATAYNSDDEQEGGGSNASPPQQAQPQQQIDADDELQHIVNQVKTNKKTNSIYFLNFILVGIG